MLEINKKPVPFFIENMSKTDTEWQVKFEDIRSIDEAEEIIGLSVFMEGDEDSDEDVWMADVVGFMIIDKHLGQIGKVINHIEKPGQDLLEIENENALTFFIPYVEELITGFDNEKEIIYTDLPEGLISIND